MTFDVANKCNIHWIWIIDEYTYHFVGYEGRFLPSTNKGPTNT
jgi:hypothetical protein